MQVAKEDERRRKEERKKQRGEPNKMFLEVKNISSEKSLEERRGSEETSPESKGEKEDKSRL